MYKKDFSKPALTITEQIKLLKERGLIIKDDNIVKQLLKNNNYYRLEGYWFYFYELNTKQHYFQQNTKIENVINLYEFDKKLRTLIFSAISNIEIAFKTQFAYQVAVKFGAFPYENPTCFKFKNSEDFNVSIQKLKSDFLNSKEEFVEHFKETYNGDLLPIWMMVEVMSFGEIGKWYKLHLSETIKTSIARYFGFEQSSVFASWIERLSIVRNICAHHARLWNKIIKNPKFPKSLKDNSKYFTLLEKEEDEYKRPSRIYNLLIVIQHLLNIIFEDSSCFIKEVKALIDEHKIDTKSMGFPLNKEFSEILNIIEFNR